MRKGFTLIELIMVIVILGILAAVALPNYFSLVSKANEAAEAGVVGGVRAGIATFYAKGLLATPPTEAYPTELETAADATAGKFFGKVLTDPITKDWSKNEAGAYVGPNAGVYTYTPATGAFRK